MRCRKTRDGQRRVASTNSSDLLLAIVDWRPLHRGPATGCHSNSPCHKSRRASPAQLRSPPRKNVYPEALDPLTQVPLATARPADTTLNTTHRRTRAGLVR